MGPLLGGTLLLSGYFGTVFILFISLDVSASAVKWIVDNLPFEESTELPDCLDFCLCR